MSFWDYLYLVIEGIPSKVYLFALFTTCFCFVLFFFRKKNGIIEMMASVILGEYISLVYCSTFFYRMKCEKKYDFHPFWSYLQPDLMTENLLNIVLFIPIGFLLRYSFKRLSWQVALVAGGTMSVSIEMMQFVFSRGVSEIDDVIHNSLGCLLGYGICGFINKIICYVSSNKKNI